MLKSWSEVKQAVEQLYDQENGQIEQQTFQNACDLIDLASRRFSPADEVGLGYWPTISLSWTSTKSIEVEVFPDRYEMYRFFDQRTDISEVRRKPEEPVPHVLLERLDRLFDE